MRTELCSLLQLRRFQQLPALRISCGDVARTLCRRGCNTFQESGLPNIRPGRLSAIGNRAVSGLTPRKIFSCLLKWKSNTHSRDRPAVSSAWKELHNYCDLFFSRLDLFAEIFLYFLVPSNLWSNMGQHSLLDETTEKARLISPVDLRLRPHRAICKIFELRIS